MLKQAIDTATPSRRLLFHVLATIAEFERDLIRDRVLAGLPVGRGRGRRDRDEPPAIYNAVSGSDAGSAVDPTYLIAATAF